MEWQDFEAGSDDRTGILATQEHTVSLEQWRNPLPTKLYEVRSNNIQ